MTDGMYVRIGQAVTRIAKLAVKENLSPKLRAELASLLQAVEEPPVKGLTE